MVVAAHRLGSAAFFMFWGLRLIRCMGHKGGRSDAAALARPGCRCSAPGAGRIAALPQSQVQICV